MTENKFHFFKTLCLFLLTLSLNLNALTSPNLNTNQITGATKGAFDVINGSAVYNLEVTTPKGTAGVKPQLAISYNSGNPANGPLGVGFGLSGLSQIAECPQSQFTQKNDASRDFNLCLDGQELVTKNPTDTYGSNTEYRTRIDSYSKIIKDHDGWIVYSKNGDIHEYGKTTDSVDENKIYRLNKTKDRYDNAINYVYNPQDKTISRIMYADNRIFFNYESREDSQIKYFNGIKLNLSQRLKSIEIGTGDSDISEYQFGYEVKDDKSYLKSITEEIDGKSLNPIYFTWRDTIFWEEKDKYDVFNEPKAFKPNAYAVAANGYNFQSGDFNGDGLQDLVHFVNGNYLHVWLANGDGTFNIKSPFPNNGYAVNSNGYNFHVGDFNGDGKSDLVHIVGNDYIHVWLSNGDGTFDVQGAYQPWPTYGISANNYSFQVADFNGDGQSDLVHIVGNDYIHVWFSNGDGTFNIFQGFFAGYDLNSNQYNIQTGDFNGDGKSDLFHLVSPNETRVWLSKGDGTFDISSPFQPWDGYNIAANNYKFLQGDFNGDGKSDFIHIASVDKTHVWLSKGDGTFEISPQSYRPWDDYEITNNNSNYKVGDFNGDGLTDLLHFTNYDYPNIWLSSGDGRFKARAFFPYKDNIYETDRNDYNYVLADFSGNGVTDILHLAANDEVSVWIDNVKGRSVIENITNYRDQDIDIEYSDLRDDSIYTSTTSSLYPNLEVQTSSSTVLKSFSANNGLGSKSKTSFSYKNFSIHYENGALGFDEITVHNEVSNTKTTSKFNKIYPFIGAVDSQEVKVNDKLVSQSSSTYEDKSDASHYSQIQLTQSIENTYDYTSGNLLTTKTTNNNDIDEYGNIKNIVISTVGAGKTYKKVLQNTYTNTVSNWILGRLNTSSVVHTDANDKSIVKSSSFIYDTDTGILLSETVNPSTSAELTKTYTYDIYGNKKSETVTGADITSRTNTYTYDSKGKNQISVTNALGQSVTTDYNIKNQVQSITDINGLTTSFLYDEMGRKIKQNNPDGTYVTWTHMWDDNVPHSLYVVREKANFLPEVLTYYDELAREIHVVKTGFDGREVLQDVTYNLQGQKYKESTPYYKGTLPEHIITEYDAMGRITQLTRPPINGQSVRYTTSYSKFDIVQTDPVGNIKTTTYNPLGKKEKIFEGSGADTSQITYTYDAMNNLKTTVDSYGNVIAISYDNFGHKESMDDPDMGYWTYKYNALGELKSQTDAKGQVTSFEYDKLGRKTQQIQGSKISSWEYDTTANAKGRLSYESSNGISKEYVYDSLSRVQTLHTTIDGESFSKEIAYDLYGRIDYTLEPGFVQVINTYNEYGYNAGIKTPKPDIIYNGNTSIDSLLENLMQEERDTFANYLNTLMLIAEYESKLNAYKNTYNSGEYDEIISDIEAYVVELQVIASEYLTYYNIAKEQADEMEYYVLEMSMGSSYNERYAHYKTKELAFNSFLDTINSEISSLGDTIEVIAPLLGELEALAQELTQEYELYKAATLKLEAQQNTNMDINDENFQYFYKVLQKDAYGRDVEFVHGNGARTVENYLSNGLLQSTTTGLGTNAIHYRNLSYNYYTNNSLKQRKDTILDLSIEYTYDSLDRIKSALATRDTRSYHNDTTYAYDALGNITDVNDVGTYYYESTRPHAVTSIVQKGKVQKSFSYDANGNMLNNAETAIEYNYNNQPVKFTKNNLTTNFSYDMNKQRYKQENSYGKKVLYLGKTYEKRTGNNVATTHKYYIYANGKVVAMYNKQTSQKFVFEKTQYLHYDNLGSVDTVTNNEGEVEERVAYKPFGQRYSLGNGSEEPVNKKNGLQKNANSSLKVESTNRGFTGHEHFEEFDFIHMNARVYDPTIGRFLSADPNIQASDDTQSYNRYSYVKNNPLKYTDPSGFFFKKIFNKIKKYIKPIIAIAVTAVIAIYAPYLLGFTSTLGATAGMTLGQTMIVGALAGAASGAIMTGTLKGTLQGAAFGAISAGIAKGIGDHYGHSDSFFNDGKNAFQKAMAHGVSRAAITKAQGGKLSAGFWSGFATSGFSVGTEGKGGVIGRTMIMGTISGTVSEATGGKFANGAVTGAFVHLFNAEAKKLVAYTKGPFVGLKEERDIRPSTSEKLTKFVDSFNVTRNSFQAGLRNAASVTLAVAGGIASGGTAWAVWGTGVVLDGYSVYTEGDLSYAAGSLALPEYTGKVGTGWATGNAIYNGYFR